MQHSISRLVLDVLKLRDPPLHQFSVQLGSVPNVDDVKVSVVEIDQITESVKVTVEGRDMDLDYRSIDNRSIFFKVRAKGLGLTVVGSMIDRLEYLRFQYTMRHIASASEAIIPLGTRGCVGI